MTRDELIEELQKAKSMCTSVLDVEMVIHGSEWFGSVSGMVVAISVSEQGHLLIKGYGTEYSMEGFNINLFEGLEEAENKLKGIQNFIDCCTDIEAPKGPKKYQEGYADGYRAALDKIDDLLTQEVQW